MDILDSGCFIRGFVDNVYETDPDQDGKVKHRVQLRIKSGKKIVLQDVGIFSPHDFKGLAGKPVELFCQYGAYRTSEGSGIWFKCVTPPKVLA